MHEFPVEGHAKVFCRFIHHSLKELEDHRRHATIHRGWAGTQELSWKRGEAAGVSMEGRGCGAFSQFYFQYKCLIAQSANSCFSLDKVKHKWIWSKNASLDVPTVSIAHTCHLLPLHILYILNETTEGGSTCTNTEYSGKSTKCKT